MPKKITQNVNKDKFLNDLPNVHPDKSTWLNKHSNYQSCNLGQIVPIYYDEVLPGEKRKITMGMISHTTTPVAPIFNSMYTELRAFFVPTRLCADLLNGYSTRKSPWVKVFGEDNKNANADIIVPLTDQHLPSLSYSFRSTFAGVVPTSKDNVFDSLDLIGCYDYSKVNFLNLAAYELIYQRHYRNENYEAVTSSVLYRMLFNTYNGASGITQAAMNAITFQIANREKDYFTGMKPFTQKGDPVKVGLVGQAPVVVESAYNLTNTEPYGIGFLGDGTKKAVLVGNNLNGGNVFETDTPANRTAVDVYADLASVNGISIEELRILIKTQELLEKDAIWGSLYAESLNSHFGCCPLDLTLQDPQELHRTTITSNMQAIFQTSSTSGESSILGTIGANSTTQTDPFVILPETEFKEHGILMICAVHKLQNVYASKYFKPKFILKNSRFDFYTPELNDLGYQKVTRDEAVSLPATAGFNEAFAEYRYKFNKLHGSLQDDFPYWAPSIENEYASAATLYKEDTAILDKALSINSSTAPQFYDAWGFEEVNTKPMSLHSIPGMDGVI